MKLLRKVKEVLLWALIVVVATVWGCLALALTVWLYGKL